MTTTTELDRALALVDLVDDRLEELERAAATLREFRERINSGKIDRDNRADLGGDLIAIGETLASFGFAVMG